MDKEQMIRWQFMYIVTCVSFALLMLPEVSHGTKTKSCCSDGLGLNYTLPMFNECKKKEHPSGSMVQTIPKLIPASSDDGGCPRRKSKLNIPPGHRVCRFPDCDSNPCENGWCEETMQGYQCHCPVGFQGKHCSERSQISPSPVTTTDDTTPPKVSCVEDITLTAELGTPNVPVNFTQPSATDLSGNVTLVYHNYNSSDEFPVGTTIVKYVFADRSGNNATCIFNVIVNTTDTTPPNVTCVEDITLTVELGTPNVSVNFTEPSATDLSGNVTLVYQNYNSRDEFPVGTTVVKYVFSDRSGNNATCIFNITINTNDTTPPNVTCVEDITLTVELGTPNVSVNFTQPSATDVSGNITLLYHNYNSSDEFPVGTTIVKYVFGDESGNNATCIFNVTINTNGNPLGLESKYIPDSSFTASSSYNGHNFCWPWRARLNLATERVEGKELCPAWASAAKSSNEWIQVYLPTVLLITGVATQGRQDCDQWVTSFKINCSVDGVTFHTVKGPAATDDMVFVGNNDRNTVKFNPILEPVACSYVRVLPLTWNGWVSLRMELYGDPPVTEPEWKCVSSKCYRLDEKRKWQEAQDFCSNLKTVNTITGNKQPSLLFLNTAEEFLDIANRMTLTTSVWINCNDKAEERNFVCDVDGSETWETVMSDAQYWKSGEPNGGPGTNEDCVALARNHDNMWIDAGCHRRYHTVCQILL